VIDRRLFGFEEDADEMLAIPAAVALLPCAGPILLLLVWYRKKRGVVRTGRHKKLDL
jgi:hypothetical protein